MRLVGERQDARPVFQPLRGRPTARRHLHRSPGPSQARIASTSHRVDPHFLLHGRQRHDSTSLPGNTGSRPSSARGSGKRRTRTRRKWRASSSWRKPVSWTWRPWATRCCTARRWTEEELIACIDRVRNALPDVPVGYVDAYYEFADRPKLSEACDVILANCYPYWEGCHMDYSLLYMKQMYYQVKQAQPDKKIIITETGWPSEGEALGCSGAGLRKRAEVLHQRPGMDACKKASRCSTSRRLTKRGRSVRKAAWGRFGGFGTRTRSRKF